MKEFEKKIKKEIKDRGLFAPGENICVGLSGGADSVALLCCLLALAPMDRYEISALHIHHGIRGPEADRDADFCRKLCEKMSIPFTLVQADVPQKAKAEGISLEEAGRKARYETFSLEEGKVALAHHANDNAETFLFHLIRGTGIRGMKGIPQKRDNIVRPLLHVTRQEILDYLRELGQDYVTDSTNEADEFTRNRIRHELLPRMEEINPAALRHLTEATEDLEEQKAYLNTQVDALMERVLLEKEETGEGTVRVLVDAKELKTAPELLAKLLLHRLLCQVGNENQITRLHITMAMDLLKGPRGRNMDFPGARGSRIKEVLTLERV